MELLIVDDDMKDKSPDLKVDTRKVFQAFQCCNNCANRKFLIHSFLHYPEVIT